MFIVSINTDLITDFIKFFKPEKLSQIGDFDDEKIETCKKFINEIKSNQELVLNKVDSKYKSQATIFLYTVILIFDIKFQNEKLSFFKNKNKLFNTIFSFYNSIFQILDLNEIKEFISLTYNDYYTTLFIIRESLKIIFEKFNEEKNKMDETKKDIKELYIHVDKYVEAKEDDNIHKICILINNIIKFEEEKNTQFISFSSIFFDKLIELTNENDLEILLILKEHIIKTTKFERFQYNFNKLDRMINNVETIFVQNNDITSNDNEYLKNYFKDKDKYKDLFALKAIEDNKIDEDFLNAWKQKKWNLFSKHDKNFITNACCRAIDMNRFKILFELLTEGKEKEDYKKKALLEVQNTFLSICQKYTKEQLLKYLDLIIKLIYKSDKLNIQNFLSKIENILDIDFIVSLYIKILNEYNGKNLNSKPLIYKYLENVNPESLVQLIKELNIYDFSKLYNKFSKYIINEKDFFNTEWTPSTKILKELISMKKYPEKDSLNKFLKNTYDQINHIKDIFKNKNYSYEDISTCFRYSSKEDILIFYEKINLLYLNSNELIKNYQKEDLENKKFTLIQEDIEKNYEMIKNYMNSLNIILGYLSNFYDKKHQKIISDIINILIYIQKTKFYALNFL